MLQGRRRTKLEGEGESPGYRGCQRQHTMAPSALLIACLSLNFHFLFAESVTCVGVSFYPLTGTSKFPFDLQLAAELSASDMARKNGTVFVSVING